MRTTLSAALLASLAALVAAVGAAADGGPSPGVSFGWDGIVARGGDVRYVAVPGDSSTVLEAIRIRDGRVLRWTSIPGSYGVPLVAIDGSVGGLSRDGKTLVLASYAGIPSVHTSTGFAIVSTRTFRFQRIAVFSGAYSFDALSPDASTLYLIQYTSKRQLDRYRVRAYDPKTRRLLPGAIVDKRAPDEAMAGAPVSRATTADGRWAYTLYARQGQPPFVHALDTVGRHAFCIDLPLRLAQSKQLALRLHLRAGELLVARGRSALAVVDTTRLAGRRVS